MKFAANALLLTLFLLTPACESLEGAGLSMPNIQAMLAGITDQGSAEEAKPALDGAIAQLQSALGAAKEGGEASAEGAAGEGGGMMESVLAQFGIGPKTAGTIKGLMDNPQVKSVLGSSLDALMGLIQ